MPMCAEASVRTFTGTVERLGAVTVAPLVAWITAIPWDAWPQQDRLADGQIRPAMVNDPAWHGLGAVTTPVVKEIQAWMPRFTRPALRMVSVVMPGHEIPAHVDKHSPRWYGRVHVPLTTDPASVFLVGGESHHLDVGTAYCVNTRAAHSVSNAAGEVPRVHLVVDWEW
jgi:hypothetical protein